MIIMTSKNLFLDKMVFTAHKDSYFGQKTKLNNNYYCHLSSLHTRRTMLFDVPKISGVTKMCSFFSSFSWRLRSINSEKEQLFPSLENDGRTCRRNDQLIDILASEHQHKMSDCALLFLKTTRKGRKCLFIYCLQQELANSNF